MNPVRFALLASTSLAATAMIVGCLRRPPASVPGAASPDPGASAPGLPARADFSYGYWLNGWRKAQGDSTPDVLCLETGRYGFALDLADLAHPRFGLLDDNSDYEQSLTSRAQRLAALDPAELTIELAHDGRTYRAAACPRQGARMWESGRLAQHFDLLDLKFADDAGNELPCYGTLDLVAWPGSLTFTAELAPDLFYADGPCEGVVGNGLCIVDKPVDIPHRPELEPERLTAECWVNIPERMDPKVYGWLLCKNENEWGQGNYGFMLRGGSVSAVLNNGGGRDKQHLIAQRGRFPQGEWQHLALTYDGATMRFYVNGNEHGSKTIDEARTPGEGLLRIGKRADGNFKVANGLYDQVRVWNRALTFDEVKAHASKPETVGDRSGLVFEESFDSGTPFELPVWNNARLRIGLKAGSRYWQDETLVEGAWRIGQKQGLTINCNLADLYAGGDEAIVRLSTPDGQTFPVRFDGAMNCYVAEVTGLKRSFPGGYVRITDYDEFELLLDCDDAAKSVPFLFDLRNPANITGLVPTLCHADGSPTGVPVQLSKNWHHPSMRAYLRAYALIPVRPGLNRYRLRIPYGFYGTLPSASHAQLCLVGYGGNQRWDQLALACGGESITFDADMSLTNVAICDVRTPLGRLGKDGNAWGWTDAGWGGDWLGVYGAEDWKLTFAEMKTAYLSHGPCLSDVVYKGAYGSDRSVLLDARVQLPRTDDYGRTFQQLTYRFQKPLPAADSHFMTKRHYVSGGTAGPGNLIFLGNADGLIEEQALAAGLKKGDLALPPIELRGPAPWWITFPSTADKQVGYIAVVIRGFEARFGGRTFSNPFVEARVLDPRRGKSSFDVRLVPPPGVETYQPGDSVVLDVIWLHLAPTADNYGGPNEAYRKHLEESPQSWETTYREIKGNDLEIEVDGGELLQELPIVIRTEQPEVTVTIQGGIGHVPIRFEGLPSARRPALYERRGHRQVKLDQSVHGNDFWQTDYDAASGTYKVTFNLPLDGKPSSRWILKTNKGQP